MADLSLCAKTIYSEKDDNLYSSGVPRTIHTLAQSVMAENDDLLITNSVLMNTGMVLIEDNDNLLTTSRVYLNSNIAAQEHDDNVMGQGSRKTYLRIVNKRRRRTLTLASRNIKVYLPKS